VAHKENGKKIAIFTDNKASFQVFSFFHAIPAYNPILLFVAEMVIQYGLQLKVIWMPGEKNMVADTLSHHNHDHVVLFAPALSIFSFVPPYNAWMLDHNTCSPFSGTPNKATNPGPQKYLGPLNKEGLQIPS
jgi:hypothetical protein